MRSWDRHNATVDFGTQQAACPVCGSAGDVLTVQDLVDMLDLQQATAMQQYAQQQAAGPRRPQRNWQAGDLGYDGGSLEDDIAGAVVGAAFKFAARAAGRRLKRAVEEQVMPAAMAKAEEAQPSGTRSPSAIQNCAAAPAIR